MKIKNLHLIFGILLFILGSCNYKKEKLPETTGLSWQYNDTAQYGDWNYAIVPGSIQLSLINDQFLDENIYKWPYIKNITWLSEKTWLYKATFKYKENPKAKREIDLVFNGLDTYAQIFVNGKLLAKTNDFFKQYKFNITPYLKKGKNEILVKISPPVQQAKKFYENLDYEVPQGYLSVIRKPYFHLNKQYSVNYTPTGFNGNAYLVSWEKMKIENLQFFTEKITPKKAKLKAKISIKSQGNYKPLLVIESQYGLHYKKHIKLKSGINNFEISFAVDSPKLWYPYNYGEQNLYKFKTSLYLQDTKFDEQDVNYGLRTIRIDTTDNRLRLFVNGKYIPFKAVEVLPFSPEVSQETDLYNRYLKIIQKANFNIILTWDKGHYYQDKFYDLCDQKGLMVIQSFMLPVKALPPKDTMVRLVIPEIQQTIERFRHHPSIIAWTANYDAGQVSRSLKNYPQDKKAEIINFNNLLFEGLIPKTVKDFDQRIYLPNLDFKNIWRTPQDVVSLPSNRIIKSIYPGGQPTKQKSVYKYYTKPSEDDLNQIVQISKRYNTDSAENLTYFSQLHQADVFKDQLTRALMNPQYDGIICTWFNDITPYTISPSAVSDVSILKAKYYALKDLLQPFFVIIDHKNQYINVTIHSEKDTAVILAYYKLYDLKGDLLWQKIQEEHIYNHKVIQTFDLGVFFKLFSRDSLLFKVEAYHNLNLVTEKYHYFKPLNKIDFQKPELKTQIYPIDIGYALEISPQNFLAKDVYIDITHNQATAYQNFFDILPGENKIVVIETPYEINGISHYINIFSYYDLINNLIYKKKKILEKKDRSGSIPVIQ